MNDRQEITLLCDPRIAAIEPADNGEPLVDARDHLRFDIRLADPRGDYRHLRRSVVHRLLEAEAMLPRGLQLLVIEGYRPPSRQRQYFDEYFRELAVSHPTWDAARCRLEASKFVAPPEVAPHQTGGAVDLTLCQDNGIELDLGTAVNDSPETSGGACFTASGAISPDAARRRRELVRALTDVGLVNYPTEWWHWSYGDRYWADTKGLGRTLYAPVMRSSGRDAA
jgi:D-alanyl-D-alanine dipeptidase